MLCNCCVRCEGENDVVDLVFSVPNPSFKILVGTVGCTGNVIAVWGLEFIGFKVCSLAKRFLSLLDWYELDVMELSRFLESRNSITSVFEGPNKA